MFSLGGSKQTPPLLTSDTWSVGIHYQICCSFGEFVVGYRLYQKPLILAPVDLPHSCCALHCWQLRVQLL